jgi:uncharacterized DUF497 family protein
MRGTALRVIGLRKANRREKVLHEALTKGDF